MFLCAVGPLIIFHELGHYWAGRWCGVRAEAFSIGFGQPIAGWHDKRGTHWRIGWLPLGGYVKFAGEYELDGMPSPRQPFDGFETAKLWQRAVIIAAGPVANFIIAFLVLCVIVGISGEPVMKNGLPIVSTTIAQIEPHSSAQLAGFKRGDTVIAIDGQAVSDFMVIREKVMAHPKQVMHFNVRRGTESLIIAVTPDIAKATEQAKPTAPRGHIGIVPVFATQPVAPYAIPGLALRGVANWTLMIGDAIGQMVTGRIPLSSLGGPLQTAQVAGEVATGGAVDFLTLIAFISINLGFMNLLPVPVLDGGHLALYGLEALRRKPLSAKARENVFRTGLAMLVTLFVVVTINDLGSFGVWKSLAGLIG